MFNSPRDRGSTLLNTLALQNNYLEKGVFIKPTFVTIFTDSRKIYGSRSQVEDLIENYPVAVLALDHVLCRSCRSEKHDSTGKHLPFSGVLTFGDINLDMGNA